MLLRLTVKGVKRLNRNTVTEIYQAGIKKIGYDMATWQDYLSFSSQLYKYSFTELVQIYEQNNQATYVATEDTWNKLQRYIKKNSNSIAIAKINSVNGIVEIQPYFDIKETEGKIFSLPNQMTTQEDGKKIVQTFFSDLFVAEKEELDRYDLLEDIITAAVNNLVDLDETDTIRSYQQFIQDSILYTISKKFDWLDIPDYLIGDFPVLSRKQLEIIGQVSNKVSTSAIKKIYSIKKDLEEEKKEEKENADERIKSLKQSEGQSAITRLRENGDEVSGRTQPTTSPTTLDGRRVDEVSTRKRELGNRDRRNAAKESVERQSIQIEQPIKKRTTSTSDLVSSQRDSDATTNPVTTNQQLAQQKQFIQLTDKLKKEEVEDENPTSSFFAENGSVVLDVNKEILTNGYYQQLDGTLPKNSLFRFRWFEGSNKIWLDNGFAKLQNDSAGYVGFSDFYTIEENASLNTLVKLKGSIIETSNISVLYETLKRVHDPEINSFSLEKELFLGTKKRLKQNKLAASGSISFKSLLWYRYYLDYLNNPDKLAGTYLTIFQPKKNEYLHYAVLDFVEDNVTLFYFSNNFHQRQEHGDKTDTITNKGTKLERLFVLTEQSEQEELFSFQQFSVISVHNIDLFKKFISDSSKESDHLQFEKEILNVTKNHVSHSNGQSLNNIELQEFKEHLTELENREFLELDGEKNEQNSILKENTTEEKINEETEFILGDELEVKERPVKKNKQEIAVYNATEQEQLELFDFDKESSSGTDYDSEFAFIPKNKPTKIEISTPKNYFPSEQITYADTKREKINDNLEALSIIEELELVESKDLKENLTREKQKKLAKYSGWGGLADIFDEQNNSWQEERSRLKELAGTSYNDMRATVLTAYYTPANIIEEMYWFAEHFGNLSHANILDPAMGTGNFFQRIPSAMRGANLTGIEIDETSAEIAKYLYPQVNIFVTGYENVTLPKQDLIIGNIPFNNIKVLDKKYDKYNFVIHDYFLAKSVDHLNPRGLIFFITSAGSMDKKDKKLREYVAKRANFIGGIRLPKTAFKQSAGTEVISDILIFQKKSLAEMTEVQTEKELAWLTSNEHPLHEGLFINRYFIDHPEQILGEIRVKNFQGKTIDVVPNNDIDFSIQLNKAFDNIVNEHNAFEQVQIKERSKFSQTVIVNTPIEVPAETAKYSFFIQNSRAFFHTVDGEYEEYRGRKQYTQIRDMLAVKQATQKLLTLQHSFYEIDELQLSLKQLNEKYDQFVKIHGHFNDSINKRILRVDNKFPLMMSLENETKNGFSKAKIFYEATIRPQNKLAEALTVEQAINYSMATTRRIDFSFIQEIYPEHSVSEIIGEAGNLIFLNPEKMSTFAQSPEEALTAWEIADEYLTGNVKDKLEKALLIKKRVENVATKALIDRNIKALKTVQPARLLSGDIKFQIGSPWIPITDYSDFLHYLLETPDWSVKEIQLQYSKLSTAWYISNKNINGQSVIAREKYGTKRINAYDLLEASLNLKQVQIRDAVKDGDKTKYVLNPQETLLAQNKQADIEQEFQNWLFSDEEREIRLLNIYNDKFNTTIPRVYSGANLVFDDMNLKMELRPHQKDVDARIIYDMRALMAHEVGAGKTAAMLTGGMYLKQHGLINKPMYVVPNHLTEQWAKEILMFYPNANILITTKKDFEKQNRQEFVSRIATGDYDAVIIGHSQFERIPLSYERQRQVITNQIEDAEQFVRELKEAEAEKWSVKQVEKFKANLEIKLEKLENAEKKDNVINFEDLGVDFLFVDEAHVYKNLFTYTKMQNVAGVGQSNSQRASDMLSKVRYIQGEHDGRNIVFATGTPVSNSMSELFVMQYFLQPEALEERGIINFDNWAATFGQVTSSLEINPEGAGYRLKNRFSKFNNLPELMSMFREVADIQTGSMLNLPVPKLKGEKVKNVVTNITTFQQKKMEEFVKRSEAIRNGQVPPDVDNMLKLTHEAKLMAIDARLIDPTQIRDPNSKLSICCDDIYATYVRTKEQKSTQIVFSDSGTPKHSFNVYQEIKDQLVEKSVREQEIAFVHDAKTEAQRDALFEKVRTGEVRIIIGSTSKLGTGTNIQNKLIKAHHIDCPWKPSDLIQREGRILRQGNENEVVEINRYVTKGTFDSYLWQIQEQKLTYISQIMSGNNINRTMDDLDETVLSAAEVKAIATDNPLLAKKMGIDNDVARLQIIRSQWSNSRTKMNQDLKINYPKKIAIETEKLNKYVKDVGIMGLDPSNDFTVFLGGKKYTERKDAFDEILVQSILIPEEQSKKIGDFKGLELYLEKSKADKDTLVLKGESSYRTDFISSTEIGNLIRLSNIPKYVQQLIDDTKKEIENLEVQINSAKKEITKPFKQQKDLELLLKEQQQVNNQIKLDTLKKEAENEIVEEVNL